MKKIFLCGIIFYFLGNSSFPQYNGNKFSFSVNGVYTTTARIYLLPNSADPVLRNRSTEMDNIFSSSLDLRYRLADEIIVGISTEYMTKTTGLDNITVFSNNNTVSIPVQDGFKLIPLELTIYYLLPFSTEHFKFLMGGGGGYYFGSQIRRFGDVESSTVNRDFAYGIHVVVSMDYLILPYLSVKAEMKFRDPEFKLTSVYSKNTGTYKGMTIALPQNQFDSRINVDGITFILGTVFHFQI